MTIKVVEYVHEYDEPDWEYKKPDHAGGSERVDFTSHVTENYYAVSPPGGSRTGINGERYDDFLEANPTWVIQGSTLTVYSREDLLGYIGLLNKLLEEFPEDE